MIRRAVTAAAAASTLLLTGCGPAETTSPGAAGPASSATASTSTSAGTAGGCQEAVEAFRELVGGLLKSVGDDQAGVRKALTDYAAQARKQAAAAQDPALGAALEKHAAAAEKLSAASDPTAIDNPEFESASGDLEKACADALTPTTAPGTPVTKIGAAGSACELPVSFELPALWKPKSIDVAELGELADLYRNGPFTVACEVDAKPAGEIGFLRVYTAPKRTGSPRSHLEAFVATENPEARKAGNAEIRKPKYSAITVGGQPAAEVTYESYNKSMDHLSKYSAFALNTPKGAVVVKLSPFGADEHANVLPAFELAKKTLSVNR